MTDERQQDGAAAGEVPAAAPDVAEVMEAEVVDAEVVDDEHQSDEPSATPRTPGGEAEDVRVDSRTQSSPDDGPSLTPPEEGEDRGDSPQGPASGEGPGDPSQGPQGEGPGAPDQGEGAPDAEPSELDTAQAQRDEYLDLAQRTKADFDNYRKRMTAEVSAAGTRARVELATGLIGVLDNLENALAAVDIDPAAALAGETEAEGHLEQGIVLTYRELVNTLMRAGVQPYDPAGEAFDPTWHEALQTRPAEGIASGTVVEVMQKGYSVDEQVIRAARVVVAE